MYFHSDGRDVTYCIYRLLNEQKQELLKFLLFEEEPPSCPLPIHGDRNNHIRIDPEEAISETGIYRDLWDRKPLTGEFFDARTRDVIDTEFDYTSYEEWMEANQRGRKARWDYAKRT